MELNIGHGNNDSTYENSISFTRSNSEDSVLTDQSDVENFLSREMEKKISRFSTNKDQIEKRTKDTGKRRYEILSSCKCSENSDENSSDIDSSSSDEAILKTKNKQVGDAETAKMSTCCGSSCRQKQQRKKTCTNQTNAKQTKGRQYLIKEDVLRDFCPTPRIVNLLQKNKSTSE